jgi:hypothetical protein
MRTAIMHTSILLLMAGLLQTTACLWFAAPISRCCECPGICGQHGGYLN